MESVLFDMDGVLVDSVSHKYDHWERVLNEQFGLSAVDTGSLIGLNTHDKYEHLVDSLGLQADRDAFVRALEQDTERVYEDRVSLLPGVEETFEWLDDAGVPIGLVSAADRQYVDLVVDRFDLSRDLSVVATRADVPDRNKPDPAIYRYAATEIGVEPSRCLAIEDSPHGVSAATGAGAYCLAYAPSGTPERDVSHAAEVVTTPRALHDRIRSLVRGGERSSP